MGRNPNEMRKKAMVLFWVRAFQAEVRPSALRCKWTLHVQGTARGHVWLEHGRKVERERERDQQYTKDAKAPDQPEHSRLLLLLE